MWATLTALILGGCAAKAAPALTASPFLSPTAQMNPSPTTPSISPTPALNAAGPWLIVRSIPEDPGPKAGLWAINPDGSGAAHLLSGFIVPTDLDSDISPDGRHIAVVSSVDTSTIRGLTLHVLDVPAGHEIATIRLTSAASEPATPSDANPVDQPTADPREATAGAIANSPISWSPDGRQVAFSAAIDGATADLYIYDLDTGAVRRISAEDGNASSPAWSPDGASIAYGLRGRLGESIGPNLDSIWLTHPADGSARQLVAASPGGEEILGWADAHTLLSTRWIANCGRHDLRAIQVETGQERSLWNDNFSQALLIPKQGQMLVSAGELFGHCEPATTRHGVYLIDLASGQARALVPVDSMADDPLSRPAWLPGVARFAIHTVDSKLLLVSPDGESQSLPVVADHQAAVSPDGSQIAWFSPDDQPGGLLIIPSGQTQGRQVFDQPVWRALWNEQSNALWFLSRTAVYRLARIDGPSSAVLTGLMPLEIVWMRPSQ